MKLVVSNARFHLEKCVGCKTCAHVCPTMAFTLPPERPVEKFKIAPCVSQCPIGNDIEAFISLISQKKYLDAYALILKTNPFPGITGRVCHSPCEQSCNRKEFDESVSIQALERFVTDRAMQEGYKAIKPRILQKEKIAIIGSGPAGLSCAYHLAKFGYKITVFEAEDSLGGMLRLGIPEYRLPKKILDWEIENIRALNVKFHLKKKLGSNLKFSDLKDFDALFISIGFHKSHRLGITGEDSQGVLTALDFLKKVNSGGTVSLGDRVAVVGGGNSAIDAARCALRLGSQPFILYRRSVDEMPAIRSERQELEHEGIQVFLLVMPKRIITKEGQVLKIECIRMRLGEVGRDGRRIPVTIPGSQFTLEVDNVILAVGELPDFLGIPSSLKIKQDRLMVSSNLATTRKGVFAGGDIVTGVGTVSEAIASGMKGARVIHQFLKNEIVQGNGLKPEVVSLEELNPDYFYPAQKIDPLHIDSVKAVSSFDEVRLGYHEDEALKEARRCFGCAAPPKYIVQDCRGCTNCEQRCPASAITIERCERPFMVGIDTSEFDQDEILRICAKAKMHPKQIVCYCTNTTAKEIVAAILKGAKTPESISLMTGARTGCTVLCVQSLVKLLRAAGQEVVPIETHQCYGETFTLWDVDVETRNVYEEKGYRFAEDMRLLEKVLKEG